MNTHVQSVLHFLYNTLFFFQINRKSEQYVEEPATHNEIGIQTETVIDEQYIQLVSEKETLQQLVTSLTEQLNTRSSEYHILSEQCALLRSENDIFKSSVDKLTTEQIDMEKRNEVLQKQITSSKQQLKEAESSLRGMFDTLKHLKSENESLEAIIEEQNKALELAESEKRKQFVEISILEKQLEYSRRFDNLSSCTSTTLSRPQSPISDLDSIQNSPTTSSFSDCESASNSPVSAILHNSPLIEITNLQDSPTAFGRLVSKGKPTTPLRMGKKLQKRSATPIHVQRTLAL